MKTDRGIAISVLTDVLENGGYANITLRKTLGSADIDPRARAFVTDLVNETLRNLIQIDHLLNNFSKTTVDNMKPFIRNLLRISVCQIKFMDRIPDRAAVNEAVVLAKNFGFANLSGFVNGVLRNIARDDSSGKIKSVALKYSYPKWLAESVTKWLGEEASLEFFESSHQPPPVIVLANTHKTSPQNLAAQFEKEGIEAIPVSNGPVPKPAFGKCASKFFEMQETADDATCREICRADAGMKFWNGSKIKHPFFILRQVGDMTRLESFKDGLFYVLDPGAMLAVDAVDAKPGQTIIDLCAAPGGKTFAMAMAMEGRGRIFAYDIHPHRVELIRQTRKRLDLSIISAAVKDATVFDPAQEGMADTVLLDAPCTGFGTIRKHPELKYSRTAKDVTDLAILQRKLLANAARYVKPGGKLVYCTCTITNRENEDNIKHFLENHGNYTLVKEEQILPQATNDGFYVAELMACHQKTMSPAQMDLV